MSFRWLIQPQLNEKKDCNPQTNHDSQEQNKHWSVSPIQDKYHIPAALGIECGPIQLTTIGCIPLRIFPDKGASRINTVPSSLPCLQCCGIISALCAQGDFQLLKRWAGWEWASDLWATFLQPCENGALCVGLGDTWKRTSLETHRMIEGWSDRELAYIIIPCWISTEIIQWILLYLTNKKIINQQ